MGLRLLSAALLFVGSALPYSGHDWLSERTGRRSWREQAGAPGWRRARQGRWKALQAPEDGAAAAEGCGIAPLADALKGSRIVGGTAAQIGAWPWVVSLQIQSGRILAHICGGSLVKNNWVLTAAHCTKDTRDPLMWRAVIGTNNINVHHPHSKKIKVKAIIIHPGFNLETFVNDIALFHLKKAVRYNEYIQPICLPFDIFQKLDQNTKCFISGWGRTEEEGNITDVLQEAEVHYISRKICGSEQSYGKFIPNTSFCAGAEDGIFDTCRVCISNQGGATSTNNFLFFAQRSLQATGIQSYNISLHQKRLLESIDCNLFLIFFSIVYTVIKWQ
ncbi:transmembrane protease serine 12 isoform X2 [Canis lupus baileyi]|uniref:transmembrane protease serine 12 isoform X2 n=1 Tax=Canis lupus dingo TaxID=286419 RepID=UPI0020C53E1E|nr:transmembrane protease serine 12 isoform X2 [Canis lupus dingo]